MSEISLTGRKIGRGHRPFIVAEMSGNHNQSLERALAIVHAAADAGAHALKLQTYTAATMTLDLNEGEFSIKDPASPWNGYSLYKLYEEAHTPWEWHRPVFDAARARGMEVFSTPFDSTAVEFLETLDPPLYKVASFELTDLPLIRCIARTGKPILMSTGMATLEEITQAVEAARGAGSGEIVLLKCTSTYPATPENTNLLTMVDMRERFGCEIGLSDHTMGFGVAVGAVALGASVIEKHFTIARADGGVDSAFSMEPAELRTLVEETARAWHALGWISYGPTEAEKPSLQFRRSIYVSADIRAGETISNLNVRIIRPGFGLAPVHYEEVIGRKAKRDVKRGTPMSWDLLA